MPPRLARLLAIVTALILVGLALWFRSGLGGGDKSGGKGNGGGGKPLVVACVTELEDVCKAIDGQDGVKVRVEAAGTTADELSADKPKSDVDAWITLDPWPAMVDVEREPSPKLFNTAPARIASSPLALLLGRTLPGACTRTPTWPCLGDAAGDQPPFKVGIPTIEDGLGPLVTAQALAGKLGKSDFDRTAIEEQSSWLDDLVGSSAAATDAPQALVPLGGTYQAVGTTRGAAQNVASSEQGQGAGAHVVALDPPMRADVIVSAPSGAGNDPGAAVERVAALLKGDKAQTALRKGKWQVPAARGDNGLPDPDVLVALRRALG
jgi:hypothetical protein